MLLKQYKEYLLQEIKDSTILVEKKMELLDVVDSVSEEVVSEENDSVFFIFRTYGIEVETFRTFAKNQRVKDFLDL
jgi:hypothetical protein